jgi:transposase-like protein
MVVTPMSILDRGRQFLQGLRALAARTPWDWRRCPRCGSDQTWKHGTYARRPWYLTGRQTVAVQRHRCRDCRRTYSEQSPLLVRGSWYAREVRRQALDLWLHGGSSVRRTAEWLRSGLGRQERWRLWRPLDAEPAPDARCWLSASTVQRWLDETGARAEATVPDQLAGVASSGQVATDGLWARLRHGTKRVLLLLTDCVTGVVYPPVVVADEATAAPWARLFARAQTAGMDRDALRGVVSDGAAGLGAYLGAALWWVNHQRCVFHLWRNLRGELARQTTAAATGLVGAAAQAVQRRVRRELVALVREVLDARDAVAAQAALVELAAHQSGAGLATVLAEHLDAALVYQIPYNAGLGRASPEWCWRDFRLRLSHGRNHGTDQRLGRAALVWAIYHNFEPAQERSERKRHYRRPGRSPLALAGVPPGAVSYLDALAV